MRLLFVSLLLFVLEVSSKNLFYKTNPAGLFSQFIQVKLLYDYAVKFNRTLVVQEIKSTHYAKPVLLDDVFDFNGYGITSRKVFPNMNCVRTIAELQPQMNSAVENLCYAGPVPIELTGATKTKFGMVEAVGINVPLKLKRLESMDSFMSKLGIQPELNFTVAHWRRGDQSVRCGSGMDGSVNCGTGRDVVAMIRKYSKDEVVYVATNERQTAESMNPIRRAKFKTYVDAQQTDELTALAMEVELMLRATTFVSWGVSEIDDIVEFERMKAGRSHCVAYERYELGRNMTFCYMLRELHKIPRSSMEPYVVPV